MAQRRTVGWAEQRLADRLEAKRDDLVRAESRVITLQAECRLLEEVIGDIEKGASPESSEPAPGSD